MARSYYRRRRSGLRRRVPLRFKRRGISRYRRLRRRRLGRRRRSGFPGVGGRIQRRMFPSTNPLGDVAYVKLKFTRTWKTGILQNTLGNVIQCRFDSLGAISDMMETTTGTVGTIDPNVVPGWLEYATNYQQCMVYAVGVRFNPVIVDKVGVSANPYTDVPLAYINFGSTGPLADPDIKELRTQRFCKMRKLGNWGDGGANRPLKAFMSRRRLLPGYPYPQGGAENTIGQSPTNAIVAPDNSYAVYMSLGLTNLSGENATGPIVIPAELTVYAYCKFFDRRQFPYQ